MHWPSPKNRDPVSAAAEAHHAPVSVCSRAARVCCLLESPAKDAGGIPESDASRRAVRGRDAHRRRDRPSQGERGVPRKRATIAHDGCLYARSNAGTRGCIGSQSWSPYFLTGPYYGLGAVFSVGTDVGQVSFDVRNDRPASAFGSWPRRVRRPSRSGWTIAGAA